MAFINGKEILFSAKVGAGGGIEPSGTIEITENGTHDVSEYDTANVNVAASGGNDTEALKGLIDRSITSLKVPSGVTVIGASALANCKQLESVELPESIRKLGGQAFVNDENLRLDHLPSGLFYIGSSCFNACGSLGIDTIPRTISYIGSSAFQAAFTGQNPNAPEEITFLGGRPVISSAFVSCPKIKTINVPWAEGEIADAPWGASNATINYNVAVEYPKATLPSGTYVFNETITMPPCGKTDITFIYHDDTLTGNAIRYNYPERFDNKTYQEVFQYFRTDTNSWESVYCFSTNLWYSGYEMQKRTVKIQTDQEFDEAFVAWFLENTVKQ